MADLDDFFAKKDRKRTKGKKFATTEEIAKKLEEKKVEKPKKEKLTFQSSLNGENGKEQTETTVIEEEEWKEFEEEKKDYSGLKIQNLTLQNEDEAESEKGDDDCDLEENEQGEMVRRKKGPWKAVDTENAPSSAPVQEAPVVQQQQQTPSSAPGKYISPALRNQQQPTPLRSSRHQSKAAPDIMNTEFFPTLTAATNETSASWGRKRQEGTFEEVRNSKSHSLRGDSREVRSLEIGNKFGALDNDNS